MAALHRASGNQRLRTGLDVAGNAARIASRNWPGQFDSIDPTAACAKPKGLSFYSRLEGERVVADAVRMDADSRSQDKFLTLGWIALPLSSGGLPAAVR